MASKLRRETRRVLNDLSESLTRGIDRWRTARHDRAAERLIKVSPGRLSASGGLALYLIYEPAGLLDSTIQTARHLADRGYPALVVSNAPLRPEEIERLASVSIAVLIRPNVGYDFGGYRDGLRYLDRVRLNPERLIILNDSIWFPLHQDETLIPRLEANPAAFQGVFYDLKGKRAHRAHYESYFYFIRRAARQSEAFQNFWRRFPMSSARWKVLKRGEKGFSQAMYAAGFRPDALATRQSFTDRIASCDAEFLRKTLLYASYDNLSAKEEGDRLLAEADGTDGWRQRAIVHVRRVAGSGTYHDTFRYAVERLFDLSLMKKRRVPQTLEMRRQYLRAVEAGDLRAPDTMMLGEIRASVDRGSTGRL
ncbi:MAG TPA: rhamnan synthesis F family protein [Albidovulum sp.]|uniref:rhamnan synthesis F family protein n=1 Tax=Albidovulum sp. TaxID=1872424 RepID=UPI002BD61039|nr:rhamnan synthesis F family protein [Albidovulum sp.]